MAFATKYRIEGTSDIYGKVTINIKKDGYSGSVINLEGATRDFVTLKIGSPSNDISSTILPGSANIQYYCITEFQTIELAQSEIFTFLVEINDSLGENIWTGWVMPEEYSESYTNTPYVVNIVASDFLDGLKNVSMANLLTTKTTLWNALRTALAGTRLELRYLESISIYSDGMADTGADSPLTQAEVSIETFQGLTCYDALNIILKPFFARVYQYRGWRIENITEKRDNYVQRLYNIGGVYVANTNSLSLVQLNNSSSDFKAFIEKTGQLNFKPSLNSANSYFPSIQRVQATGLQGFDKLSDWTSTSQLVSWTNEGSIVIQRVATEYNGSEFGVWIDGKNDAVSANQYIQSVAIPVDPTNNENINIQFDYKMDYPSVIILGSKPILNVEFFLDATSADYYWTGTQWVTDRRYVRISASPRNAWRNFSANIGILPEAGNLFIRIHRLVKSGSTGTTKLFLTKFSTNIQVEAEESNVFLYANATSSIDATFKGPAFEFGIADGLIQGANGVMEFGSVLTDNWTRKSQGDNLPITSLFLLQWLSFHQYSGAVLQGTLHQRGEHITPVSTIEDDPLISTKRYVLNSWEMSLGRGVGSVVYREIPQTDVAVTIATGTRSQIDSNDYLIPGIPAPNAPSPTPVITPQTPVINFETLRFLNGDVTGDISTVEMTPSSIQNKSRLDLTGLTANDIVIGAVRDSPDQENMTNLRLSDIKPLVSTPVTIGSPANGLSISGTQVLTIGLASTSATGALSSTDWNTFNNKLNLTSPITGYTVGANTALADTDTILQAFGKVQGQINARISGSGTLNFVPKFTASGTIGNSTLFEQNGGLGVSTNTIGNFTLRLSRTIGGASTVISASNTGEIQTGVVVARIWATGVAIANSASITRVEHFLATGVTLGTGSSLTTEWGFVADASIGTNSTNSVGFYGNLASGANKWNLFMNGSANNYLAGNLWIGTTSGTNTLDVNGTARIRTISNLGTAATSVLVPSATGVVSLRTLAELASDMSSVLFTSQTLTAPQKNQARVNIGSTSATPQVITTAGSINDLSTTSNHLVFTGASVVLSGIVAGLDGEEITILNASGTNLELLSQSALSVAGNRFASGVIVPNLSTVRIKYRTTTARWVLENVGLNDGRYVRKDINDTKLNQMIFDWRGANSSVNHIEFRNSFTTAYSLNVLGGGTHNWNSWGNGGGGYNFSIGGNLALTSNGWSGSLEGGGGNIFGWSFERSVRINAYLRVRGGLNISSPKGNLLYRGADGSDNNVFSVFSSGRVEQARSGASNESVRRDELYLNYSQTVSTTGTINNLTINADCKLLILTGATDLTGVVPVDNTRLLRIEARSASRIIRHESASSTAANRFSIGADLTINTGEVYQFIYTDSRWRFINDTRDQFAVKTTATTDQTLPSGTLTILDYDSTILNNSTATYTVGTDGRITINTTGIYTITAGVVVEANAVTALESAFLGIFRNGDLVAISSINTTIAAGAQSGLTTSTILSLTATDIIDCRALVNSVGGVANGLARRLGTLLGANATQVNSLSITKNSM